MHAFWVKSFSTAIVLTIFPVNVLGHGGGIDRCGGHHDRVEGGYHIHDWNVAEACPQSGVR
jgi:hypothetical protein